MRELKKTTVIEKISLLLLNIGMFALIFMMIFVDADVIGRYFFNKPIAGSQELVAMLMAIVSFFCIALPQFHKRHITITVVVDRFRRKIKLIVDVLMLFLSAIFSIVLIWQTYEQGVAEFSSNAITAIMKLPVWPFRIAGAFAMIFLFFAFIYDLNVIKNKFNFLKIKTKKMKNPKKLDLEKSYIKEEGIVNN